MPSTPPRSARKGTQSPEGYKRDYGPDPIGRYYHDVPTPDCPLFAKFTFVKYFRQDPREPPTPLAQLIGRKLAPAPQFQAASALADIRRDLVLPDSAPHTIATIADLIAAFDNVSWLPRDMMIEMKFIMHPAAAPHRAFEAVRGFALEHISHEHGLAALLAQHLPGRSGASGDRHIHMFVPCRLLTLDGFGVRVAWLVHDKGCAEFTEAWKDWRQKLATSGANGRPT